MPVPESILRSMWQHRLFPPGRLFTIDGARVTIRFPGTANRNGGPDFTDASVRIGGTLYRGDVEVHVHAGAWRSHGHSTDPHYNRVILHIVLSPEGLDAPACTASGRTVPVLLLPKPIPGKFRTGAPTALETCPARNRRIPFPVLKRYIRTLGMRRIRRRVRVLESRFVRLREESEYRSGVTWNEAGSPGDSVWEQLLYECVLEGMGYAGNSAAFLSLARSVPLFFLKARGLCDARLVQAVLFGTAGLLPDDRSMSDPECLAYARNLRRTWRALGPPPCIPPMHEADWIFFRLRPVNFPSARLAALCFLLPSLFYGHPLERVLAALRRPERHGPRRTIASLFTVRPERFWSRHVDFRGRGPGKGVALGDGRVQELIVNAIVPLALLYARVNRDSGLRRDAVALLRSLPRGRENSVSRRVKELLPREAAALGTPLEQQGMIHLYRRMCSRRRCGHCPVKRLKTSRRCSPVRTSRCSRR